MAEIGFRRDPEELAWDRLGLPLLSYLSGPGTVQDKHDAQSLRLFGLHGDVNDAHRGGENRLQTTKLISIFVLLYLVLGGIRSHFGSSHFLSNGALLTRVPRPCVCVV